VLAPHADVAGASFTLVKMFLDTRTAGWVECSLAGRQEGAVTLNDVIVCKSKRAPENRILSARTEALHLVRRS
jgi:hypothetical protein